MVLPANLYSKLVWKMDAHNLLHFLKLRLDSHAQWEIQELARAVLKLITPIIPITIEAFEDYLNQSVTLSRMEFEVLQGMLNNIKVDEGHMYSDEWIIQQYGLSKRELEEFKKKFIKREN